MGKVCRGAATQGRPAAIAPRRPSETPFQVPRKWVTSGAPVAQCVARALENRQSRTRPRFLHTRDDFGGARGSAFVEGVSREFLETSFGRLRVFIVSDG